MNANIALYFKHHLVVGLNIRPTPILDQEVRYIYEALAQLGNLEFFNIKRMAQKGYEPFGNRILLGYNPGRLSLLTPFTTDPGYRLEPEIELEVEVERLKRLLLEVIGLPRYSFIEKNRFFQQGRQQISFKHKFGPSARDLDGRFKIDSATASNRLFKAQLGVGSVSEETKESLEKLRRLVLFNFQKFHVFNKMTFYAGVEGMKRIGCEMGDEKYVLDVMNIDLNRIGKGGVIDK